VASNVPNTPILDLFPPCQITDLKARIQGDNLINLTWTAPGDDYDQGQGKLNREWPLSSRGAEGDEAGRYTDMPPRAESRGILNVL
jgi:hypothetical protein